MLEEVNEKIDQGYNRFNKVIVEKVSKYSNNDERVNIYILKFYFINE